MSYLTESQNDGYEQMFKEQSIRNKVIEDIKSIYHHKFIEVTGISQSLFSEPGQLPQNLDFLTGKKEITKFLDNKKLSVALRLSFHHSFQQKSWIISHFVLNAFPIYNRGWKKTEYSLDIMGNNIPLVTDEGEHFSLCG